MTRVKKRRLFNAPFKGRLHLNYIFIFYFIFNPKNTKTPPLKTAIILLLVEKDGVDEMEQVIQLFLLSGGLVLEKKHTQPH